MSDGDESYKAGFSFLAILIVIVFLVALICGSVTGTTGKSLHMAANASGTIIKIVIGGFILVGLMMVMSSKK